MTDETIVCLPNTTEKPILRHSRDSRTDELCKWLVRLPWPVIRVVTLGVSLLLLICACILIEIIRVDKAHSNGHLIEHTPDQRLYHRQLVELVNRLNTTWTAEYNRFATTAFYEPEPKLTSQFIIANLKLARDSLDGTTRRRIAVLANRKRKMPTHFDARLKWPGCWTVHHVPNQGGCGSCWATAATAVMSDRMCIFSGGKMQPQISAEDLVSCCSICGGCQGSHLAIAAFFFWKTDGLVTEMNQFAHFYSILFLTLLCGPYESYQGCRPYKIAPNCGSPCSISFYREERTGECSKKCQSLYSSTYQEDKLFAESVYWIRADRNLGGIPHIQKTINSNMNNESMATIIKRELYENGPVLACFSITEDFQHYHSGIYRQLESYGYFEAKQLYGHCAKLMGWGVDKGTHYWLYMNTWGRQWGENGFFRVDMSQVAEEIVAGFPKIEKD